MNNYSFLLISALSVGGLSVSGCTVTPQPIKPQDDIKPGRGLLTGKKGYFEIRPSTQNATQEATKNTLPRE
ncbi:MAG: hypothetical protein K2X53_05335 [Alphaproteobacteria bacterium]|nr:hypothetical protein [Alphaproteobacteria bacterium]